MPVRSKLALKTLENVESSNLIAEDCDDSVRKSYCSGMVGYIGDKEKHVVSAQNDFRYSDGLFGPDNAAAPGEAEIEYYIFRRPSTS